MTNDLDLVDPRAVDLERSLDADAAGDPADGNRASDPATAEAHDGPLEDLDALAVAFDDLGRHLDRVPGSDLRQVGAKLVGDDLVEHVHGRSCSFVGSAKLLEARGGGPFGTTDGGV